MNEIIRNQESNNAQLRSINNERPVAALSLSISTSVTVSITTAGTLIPFDFELRNLLFTWSGTQITIPNDGMYLCAFYVRTNIALASLDCGITVTRSGLTYNAFKYRQTQTGTNTAYVYSFTQYFLKDDILQVLLIPSANANLLQRNEITGGGGQAGLFHIMQITSAI